MSRVLVEPVANILPGKAHVFLRPEVNAMLREAERIYGGPIFPTGSGSAGRTYEMQDFYWQRFLRDGSPVASPPDRGPRPHMRFGAFDVAPQSYGALPAMERAGFVFTTPSEIWHAEHPACRSWPIVTEFYTEEDEMPLPLFYVATSDSPSKLVKNGDTLVRSAPGEPLRYLTPGQAADWRNSLGILDFNHPNLIGKDGSWFDAAFAEDALVHGANVKAHSWLSAGGGDDTAVLAKLDAVQADVNKPRTVA